MADETTKIDEKPFYIGPEYPSLVDTTDLMLEIGILVTTRLNLEKLYKRLLLHNNSLLKENIALKTKITEESAKTKSIELSLTEARLKLRTCEDALKIKKKD